MSRDLVYHRSLFYFLLLFVSSVLHLGGLYGDVPSDVINVYQPSGTDICITFKSSLMRGCFIKQANIFVVFIDFILFH